MQIMISLIILVPNLFRCTTINECIFFMMNKLTKKFKVHYFSPNDLINIGINNDINSMTGILYISWHHIKEKLNKIIYKQKIIIYIYIYICFN